MKNEINTKVIAGNMYAVVKNYDRECINEACKQLKYTRHNFNDYFNGGSHLEFMYPSGGNWNTQRIIIQPTYEPLTKKATRLF